MPYMHETYNGVEIWFHPLQGQFCLGNTFDPLLSSYVLSHVRHYTAVSQAI